MYLHGGTLVCVPLQEMNVKQYLVQQQSVCGTEPCAGQQSSVFPCWHYIISFTEGKHHMQKRSTFNVGNAVCACPAVHQTDAFTSLFPLTPVLPCWWPVQWCFLILTSTAGGGTAGTALLSFPGMQGEFGKWVLMSREVTGSHHHNSLPLPCCPECSGVCVTCPAPPGPEKVFTCGFQTQGCGLLLLYI